MRRSVWWSVLGGSMFSATALSSTAAVACSLAGYPAFADVRADARAIFAGRIAAADTIDGRLDHVTIDVIEAFKGQVSDPVTRALVTNACRDDLSPYSLDIGDRIVVALGYHEYDMRLDPVWVFRDDGRVRAASVEGGGRTYAELTAVLRGDLPPTDGPGGTPSDPTGLWLMVAAVVGAAAWILRPAGRRSSQELRGAYQVPEE